MFHQPYSPITLYLSEVLNILTYFNLRAARWVTHQEAGSFWLCCEDYTGFQGTMPSCEENINTAASELYLTQNF